MARKIVSLEPYIRVAVKLPEPEQTLNRSKYRNRQEKKKWLTFEEKQAKAAQKEVNKLQVIEKKQLDKEIKKADTLAKKALSKKIKKIQVTINAAKKIEKKAKNFLENATQKTQILKCKTALISTVGSTEKKIKMNTIFGNKWAIADQ